MKRMIMAVAVLAVPLGLLACDKSADQKMEGQPSTQTNTTSGSAAGPDLRPAPVANGPAPSPVDTLAESDVVTAADMEEEAEKAITSKNYKTEIASLEAEVAKE